VRQIAGVEQVDLDLDEAALDHAIRDQRAARRPPPVDRLLADAGLLRDALHREVVVALLGE
jgi:hypothetical protein